MKRHAFTMLELVFVIVVMGIIGKFGVEFLAQAYKTFIFTKVNDSLQNNSSSTVEFIATRLQHRIKDSIIARKDNGSFNALSDVDALTAQNYTVLEWVSTDIDNFRGDTTAPNWSGIADLDAVGAGANLIISPETNTTAINTLIGILSNSASGINNAAIYFIGSSSDITTDYGWSANSSAYLQDQNGSVHPIQSTGNINEFAPLASSFSEVSEYYKLAWTANAIVLSADGNLTYHTDYQPWENNEGFADATKQDLLMQDVDTFQFMAIGTIVKIQVCVATDLVEEYAVCKEKTIY